MKFWRERICKSRWSQRLIWVGKIFNKEADPENEASSIENKVMQGLLKHIFTQSSAFRRAFDRVKVIICTHDCNLWTHIFQTHETLVQRLSFQSCSSALNRLALLRSDYMRSTRSSPVICKRQWLPQSDIRNEPGRFFCEGAKQVNKARHIATWSCPVCYSTCSITPLTFEALLKDPLWWSAPVPMIASATPGCIPSKFMKLLPSIFLHWVLKRCNDFSVPFEPCLKRMHMFWYSLKASCCGTRPPKTYFRESEYTRRDVSKSTIYQSEYPGLPVQTSVESWHVHNCWRPKLTLGKGKIDQNNLRCSETCFGLWASLSEGLYGSANQKSSALEWWSPPVPMICSRNTWVQ